MKKLNEKTNINYLLSAIFSILFLFQLRSIFNVDILEHSIKTNTFIYYVIINLAIVPVAIFLLYILPIISVISVTIKIDLKHIDLSHVDYDVKCIQFRISKSVQKNYCVYRC